MKFVKYLLVVLVLFGLVGCEDTLVPPEDNGVTKYSVTIVSNDEEMVYEVNEGQNLDLEDPFVEGFRFDGYFIDDNFNNPWDNDVITKDITLYVLWTKLSNEGMYSPKINGVKDIYVAKDGFVDYLFGVTVSDDIDSNPTLVVDDSEVDLTTSGSYKVYYKATNTDGYETVVEAFVHVEEDTLDSYVETFENLANNSSSYASGTYEGVNGIVWTYEGMRTDQALDGNAITFGASSSNYLKAMLPSGVSMISIDLQGAFSGADVRNIDILINGNLVETLGVVTSKTTYEVTDINETGSVELEIRNSGGFRVTVDNIKIFNDELSQDLKDIESDIKNFAFPSLLMDETTLNLIDTGRTGSVITYEFTNSSDANNKYVNLESGLVTMPTDLQLDVYISITFMKNEEAKTITKKLVVGEGEPSTISDVLNQVGFVKTKGVLTGFVVNQNNIIGFIEDETGAVVVEFDLSYHSQLEVGSEYVLKGSLVIDDRPYIELVTFLDKKDSKVIVALTVDSAIIDQSLGRFVYTSGILQYNYFSGDAYIISNKGIIPVVVKNSYNPFIDKKAGQEVMVTGNVVFEDGVYKIWAIDSEDIEITVFNELLFKDIFLNSLTLKDNINTNVNLDLKTASPLFDLNIVWSSSHEHILSSTGVVSTSDEDNDVILTYQVYDGSVLVYSNTINVTVTTGVLLTGYYADANGLSGMDLLNELSKIISRNYNGISYSATNAVLERSDKHPTKNGYLGVYDYVSITSYNKEHVWPQSSFSKASPYRSDMHHLRISNSRTNSSRSNYYFNNPVSETTSWETDHQQHRFYPGENEIGDIARMLMYVAVRYREDNFKLIVAEGGRTSNAPSRTLGNLAVLYDWHLADPVDDFEINRNQIIYETQNNRNPFIDHPELFEDIWEVFMEEDRNRNISATYEHTNNINVDNFEDYQVNLTALMPKPIFTNQRLYA